MRFEPADSIGDAGEHDEPEEEEDFDEEGWGLANLFRHDPSSDVTASLRKLPSPLVSSVHVSSMIMAMPGTVSCSHSIDSLITSVWRPMIFWISGSKSCTPMEARFIPAAASGFLLRFDRDAAPVAPVADGQARLIEPLSERELELLRLLPSHLSYREIGERMYLSTNTVKSYVKSVYRKLDADRRTEAVEHARSIGLVP